MWREDWQASEFAGQTGDEGSLRRAAGKKLPELHGARGARQDALHRLFRRVPMRLGELVVEDGDILLQVEPPVAGIVANAHHASPGKRPLNIERAGRIV